MEAGVEEARLDAEVLLAHTLGCQRAQLYAHPERMLQSSERARYKELVARRARREPLAYLTGHREFYGLDLLVDHRVLIPRPETEVLVERAIIEGKGLLEDRGRLIVADIGTGCGAIAIALAVHLPSTQVYATDISPPALAVASHNCRRHGVARRVHLLCGDLLSPLPHQVDMIVANLPYVAPTEMGALPPEVSRYEPRRAWDGGADGLELIGRLLAQAPAYLNDGGCILLEIGAAQGDAAREMAAGYFPTEKVEVLRDGAGLDRVILVRAMPIRRGAVESEGQPCPI